MFRDGPLHWETAVADLLAQFENWMLLVHFNGADWIRQHWVEMFSTKSGREIREVR